jgi:hypothetical protein
LLILLGLLFGSGSGLGAAVDSGFGAPQLGAQRQGAPLALLRTAQRSDPSDDDTGPEPGAAPGPAAPRIVTTLVAERPADGFAYGDSPGSARAAASPYRARAPPAA